MFTFFKSTAPGAGSTLGANLCNATLQAAELGGISLGLRHLLQDGHLRSSQGVVGTDADIRSHADAFPIRLCDRADRATQWNEYRKVRQQALIVARIGAAPGRLAYDGHTLEVLECVGEIFCCREGVLAGEDVHIFLLAIAKARYYIRTPPLFDAVALAVVEIVQTGSLVQGGRQLDYGYRRTLRWRWRSLRRLFLP